MEDAGALYMVSEDGVKPAVGDEAARLGDLYEHQEAIQAVHNPLLSQLRTFCSAHQGTVAYFFFNRDIYIVKALPIESRYLP
ncbi:MULTISPECIES: hypothetical protein [unclassified Brenneria]|uniref:hypothetical protein n=1 Tax=unclassified Brenneria TaxID=2634434 RepID=UPI0029C387AB|nr:MULTISPECIES: hypothetical protein [unclassified Brenneria]MDX5627126.1 hypothetical protein [Brenneria sp. L3-3Z]MDX5693524.1 hypothetical protein [Brenneria sp. L4-2C]